MFKKSFSTLLLSLLCIVMIPAMAEDVPISAPPALDEALLMPPSIESSTDAVPAQQDARVNNTPTNQPAVKPVNILKELESRAQAGDAQCQFTLGRMYALGDGVRQDKQEAIRWYRKSALQKYAPALAAMAVAYRDGHGVQKHRVYASVLMAEAALLDKQFEQEALELQGELSLQEQTEAESAEAILKHH